MYGALAIFGFAASVLAQGVTESISPPDPAPPGCRLTDDREFSITTVNATTSTRRLAKRQNDMGKLTIRLRNGVLTSNRGDTGYIAANSQFQFDSPPQTGAIYTAGFSICQNNTLAIGDSTIFYSCLSGSFSNLYSKSQGQQCSQVFIEALEGGQAPGTMTVTSTPGASATPTSSAAASSAPASSAAVSSIADAQPQAPTAVPSASVSQISDSQPQAPTSAPTPTPSPIFAAGAPATGANMALAGVALIAAALL